MAFALRISQVACNDISPSRNAVLDPSKHAKIARPYTANISWLYKIIRPIKIQRKLAPIDDPIGSWIHVCESAMIVATAAIKQNSASRVN
jgi:hypothetical protein